MPTTLAIPRGWPGGWCWGGPAGGRAGAALAALAATLLARVRELLAGMGHEPPRFLHLQAAEGLLLLAPAAGDLVVVSVGGREALIGQLRLEMLRIAEQLD